MKIALVFEGDLDSAYCESIKQVTQLPLVDSSQNAEFTHILKLDGAGLSLSALELRAGEIHKQPTCVNFQDASLLYRKASFGKHQGLAKAVGLNKHEPMHVLDATAGLGRDAFILAGMGCEVRMIEQSPVIYSLIIDGLKRAAETNDQALNDILQKMSLHHAKAQDWFEEIKQGKQAKPDVIYLDPMFPPRSKNANVKKDIALLQEVLGFDEDSNSLLEAARGCAKHRIVVKRPGSRVRKGSIKPSFIVPGKTAHFEVFV